MLQPYIVDTGAYQIKNTMESLIINRVNFLVLDKTLTIYCSKTDDLLFKMHVDSFSSKIPHKTSISFNKWHEEENENRYVYFSFQKPISKDDYFSFELDPKSTKYFKPKYIKEILITYFKRNNFLVEPYKTGIDFSIYEKVNFYNDNWEIYRRYDFIIKSKRNEIIFNIGSESTLISQSVSSINPESRTKIVNPQNGLVQKIKGANQPVNGRIIANYQKRQELQVSNEPKKLSYKELYQKLSRFYTNTLLAIKDEYLKIEAGGLKNVQPYDLYKVNLQDNLMLFGKNQTDINAVTGMRDYGPYKAPTNASNNKFIFIYENRDDANKLYLYLKNGLKHFPGLWSYIGVPPTLDIDKSYKYNSTETLSEEFEQFITDKFPSNTYDNYFAVIIGPFNKQDTDDEQTALYYAIKDKFLQKGIPSQFINQTGIREGSFHYYLPNIAVAILAKLGGVPWRLKNKKHNELIVGFNQKKVGDTNFIGSAVFFTNEGELGSIIGYPESQSEEILIQYLRESIDSYITEKENPPERLVIHYYKPYSSHEKESIENLIQNELRLNIPFAIVEVNDSKTQSDICFDKDFEMGMPESGTYIKVGLDEYLLFNNTRYQKRPLRNVLEELPIKVKIHFADTGGFSHKDLISQVYEFSRLYWKGLKQRSQPATTIYAKLIADFTAHFDGKLPNNNIVHQTPWFL